MLITLDSKIKQNELNIIKDYLNNKNILFKAIDNNMYILKGDTYKLDEQSVLSLEGVKSCIRLSKMYHLSSLDYKQKTVVKVGNVSFGDKKIVFIAGPCSIDSKDLLFENCKILKESNVSVLRAGCYKPRTSPYFFQGLQKEGLKILTEMKEKFNMPVITEITDVNNLSLYKDVDILQVGARNMKNYELLKALGKQEKPVLIKRGPESTIDELLLSAEYVLKEGNPNVILCERGIRSFEKHTRYVLDLAGVAALKRLTHLPVIVDPSHACGDYSLVESMIYASIMAGCDGIMVEVHNDPRRALSDGKQSLKASKIKDIVNKAKKMSQIIDRDI